MNATEAVRTHFHTLISAGHSAALALPVSAIGTPPPAPTPDYGTPPPRRVDRRIGEPFHNVGLALASAFPVGLQGTNIHHDACIELLRGIAGSATSDSQDTCAGR
ncbi:hypothetical protein [Sphingomonas sp. PWP1-2]|uniref:hypothetical protein n=1 Tax=Sphingomonas sp. PWP1-2 TaxID=2804558 RepID=UPI003CF92599